jgi:hypothetical protein
MPKWLPTALILSLCMLSAGCAVTPVYSTIHSDSFATSPLTVRRVYLIATTDSASGVDVARPLITSLQGVLQESGAIVRSEVQTLHPLALGPDLDRSAARRFAPDAVFLVRIRNAAGVQARYPQWDVTLDVLDGTSKGLWRGRTTILKTSEFKQGPAALARAVISTLREKNVLAFTGVVP